MYHKILVPVEHSACDAAIVAHVRDLARLHQSSLLLIHVADGFAARNQQQLNLQESEEMRLDREYIERIADELEAAGLETDAILASGDPAAEIVAAAEREGCDLIAMATHGHRFLGDLIHGSVADAVRHRTLVPVLLVRSATVAKAAGAEPAAGGAAP
jgi:nucleotide-binding universal stress UspA family protein